VGAGHALDRGHVEERAAERPSHAQPAAGDAAGDVEQVRAAVARALRRTRPFAREGEERVAVAALLIELPEVVEAELRAVNGAKTGGDAGVRAQRFLDGADRLAGAACIAQVEPQRRHRGEPADGAREIDSVERLVAAVPFEIDEQRTLPRPA